MALSRQPSSDPSVREQPSSSGGIFWWDIGGTRVSQVVSFLDGNSGADDNTSLLAALGKRAGGTSHAIEVQRPAASLAGVVLDNRITPDFLLAS